MKVIAADLISLRDNATKIRNKLEEAIKIGLPEYTDVVKECIGSIDDALNKTQLPEYYRVAIVGRFKVGKSSFVNVLAGEKIAGTGELPETAAISVFRYAESTYAEIELISKEEWERMKEIYNYEKKDPCVERYSKFLEFQEDFIKENNDNTSQQTNFSTLEEKWLKSGGHIHTIHKSETQSKTAFLKEIKKFTSSKSALHCIVSRIIIYAPIPLLKDQIELIDTPGLEDTERLRVKLTEDTVKEVDAILLLTRSGDSYSQSDKDFIIRQLRQGQIKNLQIIVTRIDDTYGAKCREAKEDEEDEPSFENFKKEERKRIESAIKKTLDELLTDNQIKDEDGYYFSNQLKNLHIYFVSKNYFDDGDYEKSGIPTVTEKLYEILSNSYRLEQYKKILFECLENNLNRLNSFLSINLDALEKKYDADQVKGEIELIRKKLETCLYIFKNEIAEEIKILQDEKQNLEKHLETYLDKICLLANQVLNDPETTDIATHWKRRRHGGWGEDLTHLQDKIADKIFPTIESLLNISVSQLDNFYDSINTEIKKLQKAIADIEKDNKLSGLEPLNLLSCQERVLKDSKLRTRYDIDCKRHSIIAHLNDFVTREVKYKINDVKKKVSSVEGKGTSDKQNKEVKIFYNEIRTLLSNALKIHLKQQLTNFSEVLLGRAKMVEPQISKQLISQLEERLSAINSKLSLKTLEEKKLVEDYLTELYNYCNQESSKLVEIESA